MSKKIVPIVLFVFLLLQIGTTAHAEQQNDIDFANLTCEQFIDGLQEMDDESAGYVMMWLDGYLSGITNDTLLHWEGLEEFGTKLAGFCQKNPHSGLLDSAKAVGIRR